MTAATRADLQLALLAYAVSSLALHFTIKFANFYALPAERPTEDEPIKDMLPIPKLMVYPVEETKRRLRIHANTVENCYFDFANFWAALFVAVFEALGGGGHEELMALTVLVIMYAVSRAAFFYAYATACQPWRTIFFTVGTASSLTASLTMIVSAARSDFSKLLPA